jgi:endonuclease YncB( thermonuclease family)
MAVPLQRPRRIFRASTPSFPGLATLRLLIVCGLGIGALTALVAIGLSSSLFGRATNPVERIDSPTNAIAVIDGATLRMRSSVVHLAGVESPERGQPCRGGDASVDCGAAAANALARLLKGHDVVCDVRGRNSRGRAFAICELDGVELNRAIIAAGWAWADDNDRLAIAEAEARAGHRGMWRAAPDDSH